MKKINTIINPHGRMPIVQAPKNNKVFATSGSGAQRIPAVAIRNPFARQKG